MKATGQYFPVMLFILLHKMALTFVSVDEILKCDRSNKANEQNFPVVLSITVCKIVLTVESLYATIQLKATEKYFLMALVTGCAVNMILAFSPLSPNSDQNQIPPCINQCLFNLGGHENSPVLSLKTILQRDCKLSFLFDHQHSLSVRSHFRQL